MHSEHESYYLAAASRFLTLLLLCMFTIVDCSTISSYSTGPPPRRLAPERSIIAIEIIERGAIRFVKSFPDKVYFVRMNEEGDLLTQEDIIPSNSKQGDYVYLVNARPGRYAAVATWKRVEVRTMPPPESTAPPDTSRSIYRTFFSKDLVTATEVIVPPSTLIYMGRIEVDLSSGMSDGDEVQRHFLKLLSPTGNLGFIERMLTGNSDYINKGTLREIRRNRETELEFLKDAIERFEVTDWIDLLRARLDELTVNPMP